MFLLWLVPFRLLPMPRFSWLPKLSSIRPRPQQSDAFMRSKICTTTTIPPTTVMTGTLCCCLPCYHHATACHAAMCCCPLCCGCAATAGITIVSLVCGGRWGWCVEPTHRTEPEVRKKKRKMGTYHHCWSHCHTAVCLAMVLPIVLPLPCCLSSCSCAGGAGAVGCHCCGWCWCWHHYCAATGAGTLL